MARASKPEEQPDTEMSVEEIQREIALVELQTKRLGLAEAKKRNAEFEATETRRHEANKKRMDELAEGRRNHENVIKTCRHKSGGTPKNILKGGGIGSFSLITRAIMPDGVTILLQCPRCRMMKYPPEPSLKKANPNLYLEELTEYNRLLEESTDNGIEHAEMRGPTFMFKNAEGVPIVPERV